MATDFSAIPIRTNSQRTDASWWNTIRSNLITAFGTVGGQVSQSLVSAASNQDITDLVFDSASYEAVDIEIDVRRETDTTEKRARLSLRLLYYTSTDTWTLEEGAIFGDNASITFDKSEDTSGGSNVVTVNYTTTALAGSSVNEVIYTKWQTWTA